NAVEPVFLDHGVAGGIANGNTIANLQRLGKTAFAKDVAGQAGFAADHVLMFARTFANGRGLAVNEQVEHVGFGRAVDHGQVLAIETDIQHADFKRGAVAHGGFTGFQINLDVVVLCKAAQALAKGIQRVVGCGKADPPAQADPLHLPQDGAIALFNLRQQVVEPGEIVVLAVVVDHQAVKLVGNSQNAFGVAFTQSAECAGRVGQIETGATDARVQAQAYGFAGSTRGKSFQLLDGIENDLVAVCHHVVDFVIGKGDAIGMGFAAELLVTQ